MQQPMRIATVLQICLRFHTTTWTNFRNNRGQNPNQLNKSKKTFSWNCSACQCSFFLVKSTTIAFLCGRFDDINDLGLTLWVDRMVVNMIFRLVFKSSHKPRDSIRSKTAFSSRIHQHWPSATDRAHSLERYASAPRCETRQHRKTVQGKNSSASQRERKITRNRYLLRP